MAKVNSKKDSPQEYTAKNLAVLEGLEAVRKRPGMYIGSNDSRGLMHCLWEIVDNGVDERVIRSGEIRVETENPQNMLALGLLSTIVSYM